MRFLWAFVRFCATVAALGGVAALAAWLTIQYVTTRKTVEVPDIVGLDTTTAIRRLDETGLRIQFAEDDKNTFDDRVPAGHILRQEPQAGAQLKQDRKVRVVLSLGPRHLYVPRVVGEPVTAAQVKIQEAGLRVGEVVRIPSAVVAENLVIDQEPTRPAPRSEGEVNLLVSSGGGGPAFVMPDLIGRPSLRARAFFELKGFRVRVETESYDGVPEGTVIRQKPLAGYALSAGEGVSLWVSRPSVAP